MFKFLTRSIVIVGCLMMVSAPVLFAQDDPDHLWYWAYDDLERTYTAFDLEGNSQIIGTEMPLPENGWRISPSQAMVFTDDSELEIYALTADTMTPVTLDAEVQSTFIYLDGTEDFSLLNSPQFNQINGFITRPLLLIDHANLTAHSLPTAYMQSAVFSEDGSTVRYVRVDTTDADETSLVATEIDLASGETRDLFTFPEDTRAVSVGAYGDDFLLTIRTSESPMLIFSTADVSGTIETIAQVTAESELLFNARIVEKSPMFYALFPMNCSENCSIQVSHFGEAESTEFILPRSSGNVIPLTVYEATETLPMRLLVLDDRDVWVIHAGGDAELLGVWDPIQNTMIATALSDDGRYLMATHTNQTEDAYTVWDMQSEEVLAEETIERLRLMGTDFTQSDIGFMVTANYEIFNVFVDGDFHAISEPFTYGTLTYTGDVLLNQLRPTGEIARGVYLYDVETQETHLILADTRTIPLRQ